MKAISVLTLSTLLLASAVWADSAIYKWVDEKGVVHYSTEPHSDAAKPIGIVNTGNSLPNPSTAPFPASATGPGAAAGADDGTLVQVTPGDSRACRANRDRLSKYLQAGDFYRLDDKGQKVLLSAEEKAQALEDARNAVRQMCKPGGGQ